MFYLPLFLAVATTNREAAFAGIQLGISAKAAVVQLGDPLNVTRDQDSAVYLYLTPSGNALELLRVVRGNVVAVSVRPAPWKDWGGILTGTTPTALGVGLGDSDRKIAALPQDRLVSHSQLSDGRATQTYHDVNGLDYIFEVQAHQVAAVTARLPMALAETLPTAKEPPLHDGSTAADAIVIMAPSEMVGIRAEYVFLAMQTCGRGGHWRMTLQGVSPPGPAVYDILDAVCTSGGAKRSFIFNINSFYGKI